MQLKDNNSAQFVNPNIVLGLLLLLVAPRISICQTFIGRVIDHQTKKPLTGVSVIVGITIIGTITDSEGNFRLSYKDKKTKKSIGVTVSLLGYRILYTKLISGEHIELSLSRERNSDVEWNPNDIPLKEEKSELGNLITYACDTLNLNNRNYDSWVKWKRQGITFMVPRDSFMIYFSGENSVIKMDTHGKEKSLSKYYRELIGDKALDAMVAAMMDRGAIKIFEKRKPISIITRKIIFKTINGGGCWGGAQYIFKNRIILSKTLLIC